MGHSHRVAAAPKQAGFPGGKARSAERLPSWQKTTHNVNSMGVEDGGIMDPIVEAAFKLNLAELKRRSAKEKDLAGTLLAACSAHDADPKEQVQVMRFLLKAGVDPNETDKNGVTPLHRAVRFRNVAAVKELIRIGVGLDVRDKKSGSTPLHRAVVGTGAPKTKGKDEEARLIIEALLEAGADPSIKNKMGKTPLAYVKDPGIKALLKPY
jgi:ankyrin repeat protein